MKAVKDKVDNPVTLEEARTLARVIKSGRKMDRGHAAWVIEQLCQWIETGSQPGVDKKGTK